MDYGETSHSTNHKSVIVVTQNSGKILGHVNCVLLNASDKRISGIAFRQRFLGQEFFLKMKEVYAIGEDVVFVQSESSAIPLTSDFRPYGDNLRDFQGIWIYLDSGKALGALTDVGFSSDNWELNKLYLNEGRVIKIDANQITIDHEKIIVPANVLTSMELDTGMHGLLAGLFGSDVVKQANIILQRTLRGMSTQQP